MEFRDGLYESGADEAPQQGLRSAPRPWYQTEPLGDSILNRISRGDLAGPRPVARTPNVEETTAARVSILDRLSRGEAIDPQELQIRDQEAATASREFGKALRRSGYSAAATVKGFAGQLLENVAPEAGRALMRSAQDTMANMPRNLAPKINSFEEARAGGLRGLSLYGASALGEGGASILPPIAGGLVGGLLGRTPAGRVIGGLAASLPMTAGEVALNIQDDPRALANTTPAERTALMLGSGTVGSIAEVAVPEALILPRLLGNARRVAPGISSALSNIAKTGLAGGIGEFGTEAAQDLTGQAALNIARGDPISNLDLGQAGEAGIRGALPGGVIGGVAGGVQSLYSNVGAASDAVKAKAPTLDDIIGGIANAAENPQEMGARLTNMTLDQLSKSPEFLSKAREYGLKGLDTGADFVAELKRQVDDFIVDNVSPENQERYIQQAARLNSATAMDWRALRSALEAETGRQFVNDLAVFGTQAGKRAGKNITEAWDWLSKFTQGITGAVSDRTGNAPRQSVRRSTINENNRLLNNLKKYDKDNNTSLYDKLFGEGTTSEQRSKRAAMLWKATDAKADDYFSEQNLNANPERRKQLGEWWRMTETDLRAVIKAARAAEPVKPPSKGSESFGLPTELTQSSESRLARDLRMADQFSVEDEDASPLAFGAAEDQESQLVDPDAMENEEDGEDDFAGDLSGQASGRMVRVGGESVRVQDAISSGARSPWDQTTMKQALSVERFKNDPGSSLNVKLTVDESSLPPGVTITNAMVYKALGGKRIKTDKYEDYSDGEIKEGEPINLKISPLSIAALAQTEPYRKYFANATGGYDPSLSSETRNVHVSNAALSELESMGLEIDPEALGLPEGNPIRFTAEVEVQSPETIVGYKKEQNEEGKWEKVPVRIKDLEGKERKKNALKLQSDPERIAFETIRDAVRGDIATIDDLRDLVAFKRDPTTAPIYDDNGDLITGTLMDNSAYTVPMEDLAETLNLQDVSADDLETYINQVEASQEEFLDNISGQNAGGDTPDKEFRSKPNKAQEGLASMRRGVKKTAKKRADAAKSALMSRIKYLQDKIKTVNNEQYRQNLQRELDGKLAEVKTFNANYARLYGFKKQGDLVPANINVADTYATEQKRGRSLSNDNRERGEFLSPADQRELTRIRDKIRATRTLPELKETLDSFVNKDDLAELNSKLKDAVAVEAKEHRLRLERLWNTVREQGGFGVNVGREALAPIEKRPVLTRPKEKAPSPKTKKELQREELADVVTQIEGVLSAEVDAKENAKTVVTGGASTLADIKRLSEIINGFAVSAKTRQMLRNKLDTRLRIIEQRIADSMNSAKTPLILDAMGKRIQEFKSVLSDESLAKLRAVYSAKRAALTQANAQNNNTSTEDGSAAGTPADSSAPPATPAEEENNAAGNEPPPPPPTPPGGGDNPLTPAQIDLLRSSAEKGDVGAQFELAWMYDHGEGAAQDKVEAEKWYRMAADQGDATAQYNLALMYETGDGVPQNYTEAVKWYQKSAEQGDDDARLALEELLGQKTSAGADGAPPPPSPPPTPPGGDSNPPPLPSNDAQKRFLEVVERIMGKRVRVQFEQTLQNGGAAETVARSKRERLDQLRTMRRDLLDKLRNETEAKKKSDIEKKIAKIEEEERKVDRDEAVLSLIRVATGREVQAGLAEHEAFHAAFKVFFTPEERGVITTAFTKGLVARRLREVFKDEPDVLAAIDRDPEEAAAYAFQIWSRDPDLLKLGERVDNLFNKFLKWVRNLFGVLTYEERAELLLNDLASGRRAEQGTSPVAKILDKDRPWSERAQKYAQDLYDLVQKGHDVILGSVYNRLADAGNPILAKIARAGYQPTGEEGGAGMVQRAITEIKRLSNRLDAIFKGLNDEELKALQDAKVANVRPTNEKLAARYDALGKFFDDMYKYQTEAGIDLGDRGTGGNYYPLTWDPEKVLKDKAGFIKMLEPYAEQLRDMKKTPLEIWQGITEYIDRGEDLVSVMGQNDEPLSESSRVRSLDFISRDDRRQFMVDSPIETAVRYVKQAVRQTEFVRAYGVNGSKLKAWKAEAMETYGATQDDMALVNDYIDGLLGNKEIGMSRELKDLYGALTVYQNVRLLPFSLFNSLVDPLGIAIRSNSMGDAWGVFTYSLKNLFRDWKSEYTPDQWEQIAVDYGIVERSGTSINADNLYTGITLRGTTKKINDAFFKYNLLNGWIRSNTIAAVKMSQRFMYRSSQNFFGEEQSKRYLDELGLKAEDIVLGPDGERILIHADELMAAGKSEQEAEAAAERIRLATEQFVRQSLLNPTSAELPNWASNPYFMPIAHLKSFVFGFNRTILDRVQNEMENDNFKPLLVATAYVPGMIAATFLKDMASGFGEEPPYKKDWGVMDYLQEGVAKSGLTGTGQFFSDMQQDIQFGGHGYESLAGPTLGQLQKGLKVMTTGDDDDFWRFVVKSLPANPVFDQWMLPNY